MNDITYCSPSGALCRNYKCERHICHAPKGCAVSVSDGSASCESYEPLLRVLEVNYDNALKKVVALYKTYKGEHPEATFRAFAERVEMPYIGFCQQYEMYGQIKAAILLGAEDELL